MVAGNSVAGRSVSARNALRGLGLAERRAHLPASDRGSVRWISITKWPLRRESRQQDRHRLADESIDAADDAASAQIPGQDAGPLVDRDGNDSNEEVGAEGSRDQRIAPPYRAALLMGLAMIAALAALVGWQGWNVYESRQAAEQRAVFLQAARQAALNLTTIDWQHADADVQRIVDSTTGTFHDDFSKRSQPFIDVLKQAQSKSQGTIVAAALESASGSDAQALVAVSVAISDAGTEPHLKSWRLRIAVQKSGDQAKVSNVEFVP